MHLINGRDSEIVTPGFANQSQSRFKIGGIHLVIVAALIHILAWDSAIAAAPDASTESASGNRIGLRMVLDEGEIVIALDLAAAPETIQTLLGLIEPEPQPEGEARGYYDGLTLSHTWPHIEIGTSVRPGEPVEIPQEIDAASLGLVTEKITERSTAYSAR